MKILNQFLDTLKKRLSTIFSTVENPSLWALDRLGIDLYDNQIEIIDAVCDLNEDKVAIVQARGSGKTFSVALSIIKLCLDIPKFKVGVFGPKAEQAARIIKVIREEIVKPGSAIYETIKWKDSTNSRLSFVNGSEVLAISAGEATMQEGYHFHIVVLDECHRISDVSVNQRIVPMLGSYKIAKIVKLGVSMYKQNFWKSCTHPQTAYKVLMRDWRECPILLKAGSIVYQSREYSKYVIDQMPLRLKESYFPDRPDLHYDGAMTEFDFNTQYEMKWADDINLELSSEDQTALIESDHEILKRANPSLQEQFFFGLDTASGTLYPGKKDLDYTALAIWRKKNDNVKEKVAAFEWQGDPLTQLSEIETIINPKDGLFPCMFGLADYSNIAQGAVEQFKAKGIPIDGIIFQQINDKIEAPSDMHDDHCCFSGNTKIRLLDGTTKTIAELSDNLLEDTWAYSVDQNNHIVPGKISRAWKVGNKETLKITLDNNEFFECTPDHKIMLRDGSYKEAKDLQPNDSLMPLYTKKEVLFNNLEYEFTYDPGKEIFIPTHRIVVSVPEKMVPHHKNFNRFDNRPTNIQIVTSKEHWQIHGKVAKETNKRVWSQLNKEQRIKRLTPSWKKLKELYQNPKWMKFLSESIKKNLPPVDREIAREKAKKQWEGISYQERLERMKPIIEAGANARRGKSSWNKGKRIIHITNCQNCHKEFDYRFSEIRKFCSTYCCQQFQKQKFVFNHKVVKIEKSIKQDVYDITVEVYHNFALDCGVFVHNCSDVLAVWAMDKTDQFKRGTVATYQIPKPVTGVSTVLGRGIPTNQPKENRYLQ